MMDSSANLEEMPSMEEVLEQTAAAILGLDPDYSTQQVSEDTPYRQHLSVQHHCFWH